MKSPSRLPEKSYRKRIPLPILALATRQISVMMEAGVPLPQILSFLGGSQESPALQEVFGELADRVSSGSTLSAAMRRQDDVFSEVFCGLVETGESTGLLGECLSRLADLTERQLKLRQRLVATLTYPAALCSVTTLCLFVFVTFVIPLLKPVFEESGMPLPLMTLCLLYTRDLLIPLAISLGLLLLCLPYWSRPLNRWLKSKPERKLAFARLPFRIPLVGPVLQKMAVTQLLFALSGSLDSGTGLLPALGRASLASGNDWIVDQVKRSIAGIRDGLTLREAFLVCGIFPKVVILLVGAGEDSASLSSMIGRAAVVCEEDCDAAIDFMANLMEPILMLGMGAIVGFIVVAGMLPTLQMISSL